MKFIDIEDNVIWKRIVNPFYNFKYWFINGFITRTHRVSTSVPFGQWRDADTRMLHACMNLLVEFVEKEEGLENLRSSCDPESYKEKDHDIRYDIDTRKMIEESYIDDAEKNREILAIYEWWQEYLNNESEFRSGFKRNSKLSDNGKDILLNRVIKFESEEEGMLIRLMKVRGYLWT
jgi:hypothetical protein